MAGNNTFAIDGINNAITGTKKEAAVVAAPVVEETAVVEEPKAEIPGYRFVETDTTFVRPDSGIELHTITEVGLYLSFVIYPIHTEGMDTIRLYNTFDDFCLSKFWVLVVHIVY